MSILRILYRHAWKGCVCLSNVGISALPASVRDHVETCRILKIASNPKYTQAMPQHCSAWLISPMALIATYLYSVASRCIWMISFTKVQYPLKKCIILSKCSNTSNAAFRLKTRYFFERLGYLVLMQYGGDKACNPSRKCSIPAEESCMYFRISGRKPAGKPAAAFFKHLQYLHNKVGKLNLVCRKFQWTLRAWIAQNPLSPEDLRQIYIYTYIHTLHYITYIHIHACVPSGFPMAFLRPNFRPSRGTYPHRGDNFAPCEALGPPQPAKNRRLYRCGDVSILNKAEIDLLSINTYIYIQYLCEYIYYIHTVCSIYIYSIHM